MHIISLPKSHDAKGGLTIEWNNSAISDQNGLFSFSLRLDKTKLMEAGLVGNLGVPAMWPAGEGSKVEAELAPNHRQPMGGKIVMEMVWWRARATKILVQVNLYHLLKYLAWLVTLIHSDLRSEKNSKTKQNAQENGKLNGPFEIARLFSHFRPLDVPKGMFLLSFHKLCVRLHVHMSIP